MPSDESISQQCELRTDADLLAALDTRSLEHLDVDDHRTFVLYSEAVLDLQVTEERSRRLVRVPSLRRGLRTG